MLRVENISKHFGGLKALQHVTFNVKENEILSLIGPNGAGKSTMMNIITGFEKPTDGKIYFQDEDITSTPANQLADKGIYRTFQIARLFGNMTVLENVMIGSFKHFSPNTLKNIFNFKKATLSANDPSREKAYEMLKFLGIEKIADQYPGTLSYGQIRLVEVARALIGKPKILMLDEPACGLNASEVEAFKRILLKVNEQGTTILLIEHDMRLVMDISQRIVVLNNGQLLTVGTPNEIKSNQEVITAYLGRELKNA